MKTRISENTPTNFTEEAFFEGLKKILEEDLKNIDKDLKPLTILFIKYLNHINIITEWVNETRKKIKNTAEEYKNMDSYKSIKDTEIKFSKGLIGLKKLISLKLEIYEEILEDHKKGIVSKKWIDCYIKKFERIGFYAPENDEKYWNLVNFFQLPPSKTERLLSKSRENIQQKKERIKNILNKVRIGLRGIVF